MAQDVLVWEKTYTSEDTIDRVDISSVQYDSKYVIFSDGVSGVYVWNGTMEAPTLLVDLVAFLPDNYGSTASSLTLQNCPALPPGKYLTLHRGRVFYADQVESKVYYCGTRTDLDRMDGVGTYPYTGEGESAPTPIKPWELWNIRMDLSRYNVGNGGSIVVGSSREKINGIRSTEEGLIVFKDRSIFLWNWPDSAAPHEVTQGASLKKISDGLGAIGGKSIDQVGEMIVFIGRDSFGSYGIYIMNGTSFQEISIPIKQKLQNIVLSSKLPYIKIVGNQLLVAYDNGDGELSIRHMFDMIRNAWVDYTSPRLTHMEPSQISESLLMGTDVGIVLAYPSSQHEDLDIDKPAAFAPIPFLFRSRYVDNGTEVRDKKFRKSWATVQATSSNDISMNLLFDNEDPEEPIKIPYSGGTTEPTYNWQFAFDDTTSIEEGLNELYLPTAERAKNMQIELCGTADSELSIHTVQAGWREREEK